MKTISPLAVWALVITLSAGCASMTGRSAGRYVDDKVITAEVKSKLVADRAANLTRVGVTTVNGAVHLDGIVDTAEQKARAQELARQVKGVSRVVNNLQVNPPPATSVK